MCRAEGRDDKTSLYLFKQQMCICYLLELAVYINIFLSVLEKYSIIHNDVFDDGVIIS
jgi:hypothetical protein